MSQPHHSIQSVSRRTGLSPHVIRVWEKRYGAVKPNRTETNRRLYSDAEIQRLQWLRRATEAGHSIGAIAALESTRLEELASHMPEPEKKSAASPQSKSAQEFVQQCITATQQLDALAFEETLHRASVLLGQHGLVEQVVAPVAEAIGDLWRDGTITAAHEHFASAAIRVFLGHASRPFALPANAPHLIVATPAGQLHELGAVMVAATATDLGWRVTYLGTSLPAAEIAGAATQHHARAVALSIVYPVDDENLLEELNKLRRYLPSDIQIIVGGRAAAAYDEAVKRIGATRAGSLTQFGDHLNSIRALAKRKAPGS
jgi:DNA-binding transcriptional MerR regulator/methylmalonyl-CoA mutase cobalamin-binding subunit